MVNQLHAQELLPNFHITQECARIILQGLSWQYSETELDQSDELNRLLSWIQLAFPNLAAEFPHLPFP